MNLGIADITPGMSLLEDVLLPNGVILLNSQTQLTAEHIVMLKRRGICELHVKPPDTSNNADTQKPEKPPEKPGEVSQVKSEAPIDKNKQNPEKPVLIQPVPPVITVAVSMDAMSACLHIEPAGPQSTNLTVENLTSALESNGVVYGIKNTMLSDLATRWKSNNRTYEIDKIALGEPAKPGRQGQPEFEITCITQAKNYAILKNTKHCYELKNCTFQFSRVDSGTKIGQRFKVTPPEPGKNVKGEDVLTDEITPFQVNTDHTVEVIENGEVFNSNITGVPYFIDGQLGVHPLDFDGSAELEISADKMTAELTIFPAMQGGVPPSESSIRELISKNRITFGLMENVIQELIEQMSGGTYPEEPIVIASGETPVDGRDGTVEFLFNPSTSLTPKINPDGSVDFKNVDLIHPVVTESRLARLIPPENGTPGRDITGAELHAKNGKKTILPRGTNTKISEKDESILLSAIDGNVTYNGRTVEVHEGYVVNGHIDYSSGNVKYEKSVVVKGDVKTGFSVECGGDLDVYGTIEDANINVMGTVLCRLGFMGQGKGTIDSRGDVNITFMNNQTVRARGNVIIAREALNCTIMARKTISISGKPLSAAGGVLVAGESIVLKEVGNHSGIKTVLEAGIDFVLAEELKKTDTYLKELTENCRGLMSSYKRFDMLIKMKKKLAAKDEFTFAKLRNLIGKVTQQIKSLDKRKRLILEKLTNFDKAFIKIEYAAMPGTIFKFGEHHHLLNAQLTGPKCVRLLDNEIKFI